MNELIDLENVKKKILATVDKAGYITEKMLIDYCIEDNIPDYAIDQLCDQLFDAHVPVLDIPIFIENKYLALYSKYLTENTYSKKEEMLASVIKCLACFSKGVFEKYAEENRWAEIRTMIIDKIQSDDYKVIYEFYENDAVKFIDFCKKAIVENTVRKSEQYVVNNKNLNKEKNEESSNESKYDQIVAMELDELAIFIYELLSEGSEYITRGLGRSIKRVELKDIVEWLKMPCAQKAEGFYAWLKDEGFMARVIDQFRHYITVNEKEYGYSLLDIKEREKLVEYIDMRRVAGCPAKERTLYKYYLEYWDKH